MATQVRIGGVSRCQYSKVADAKKREKSRENNLRSGAVRDAWQEEKERVLRGEGTRDWTVRQQHQLIDRNSVRGFYGHHMISVKLSPELAGDKSNIQFLTFKEHLFGAHRGLFRTPANGYYDPVTRKMTKARNGSIPRLPVIRLSKPSRSLRMRTARRGTDSRFAPSAAKEAEREKQKISGGSTGMAINVNEQAYEDMIGGLTSFAEAILTNTENLSTLLSNCSTAMDGDEIVEKAVTKMKGSTKAYLLAGKEAALIAKELQAELDAYRKMKQDMDSDE